MSGGIGMRLKKVDKEEAALLVFRGERDPAMESLSTEVRKMLGLDPQAKEFKVVYGAIPQDNKEIALLTRSILEVLVDISTDIEVPASDVQEKRVSPTFAEMAASEKIRPLMRIQNSSGKPGDAFVSIPYRNSYFWIDDRDFMSKKKFSFLDVCLHPGRDGRKGRPSYCDDTHRIGRSVEDKGPAICKEDHEHHFQP